jgi:hypothetical protein
MGEVQRDSYITSGHLSMRTDGDSERAVGVGSSQGPAVVNITQPEPPVCKVHRPMQRLSTLNKDTGETQLPLCREDTRSRQVAGEASPAHQPYPPLVLQAGCPFCEL